MRCTWLKTEVKLNGLTGAGGSSVWNVSARLVARVLCAIIDLLHFTAVNVHNPGYGYSIQALAAHNALKHPILVHIGLSITSLFVIFAPSVCKRDAV